MELYYPSVFGIHYTSFTLAPFDRGKLHQVMAKLAKARPVFVLCRASIVYLVSPTIVCPCGIMVLPQCLATAAIMSLKTVYRKRPFRLLQLSGI